MNKANKSKVSIKTDGITQFKGLENSDFLKKFYSELAADHWKKLPTPPNKFTIKTSKTYYSTTSCSVSHNWIVELLHGWIIKGLWGSCSENFA